jgi:hypothetical protein
VAEPNVGPRVYGLKYAILPENTIIQNSAARVANVYDGHTLDMDKKTLSLPAENLRVLSFNAEHRQQVFMNEFERLTWQDELRKEREWRRRNYANYFG